jgi:hypothetical protein
MEIELPLIKITVGIVAGTKKKYLKIFQGKIPFFVYDDAVIKKIEENKGEIGVFEMEIVRGYRRLIKFLDVKENNTRNNTSTSVIDSNENLKSYCFSYALRTLEIQSSVIAPNLSDAEAGVYSKNLYKDIFTKAKEIYLFIKNGDWRGSENGK